MTASAQQRELPTGVMVGVFRIERTLGIGGFGITYLAFDTSLNLQVALKEYFPQNAWRDTNSRTVHCYAGEAEQTFQVGLQRFHKEGQTLAQFKHPNIVGVRQMLSANNTAYLVMDYEHGEELEAYLRRLGRPLGYQEAENIFNPLLDGLRAVHDRGLLHLDIKPENIFLRADSIPVLIDFGGARHQLGQASRAVSFLVASDGYAPNEQYTGTQLQPTTDVYAVGATIYRCIIGQVPADAPKRGVAIVAMIDGRVDPLPSVRQRVGYGAYPEHFLQTLDDALSMRVSNRPQSVRELQQRLFVRETIDPPPPPPPSNWIAILAKAGFLVVLMLGIVFFVRDAQHQKAEAERVAIEAQRQREQVEQQAAADRLERQLAEQRAIQAEQQKSLARQQLVEAEKKKLQAEQQLVGLQQQEQQAEQIPQVTRDEKGVMSLIHEYVRLASNQGDSYASLKLYTEPVDYYDKKQANHEFIVNESKRYAGVYPTHEFRQLSEPVLTWHSDREVSAVFKIGFHLCCKESEPPKDGEKWLKMRLLQQTNGWKIAVISSEKI